MSHPADGEAWQDLDRKHPTFVDDPRNLRLAVTTDGFNAFGNFSSTYSMWPVLVTPLNLPPWECVPIELLYVSTDPRTDLSRKGF